MPVTVEKVNNELFAYISGEIDHHSAAALREKIDDSLCSSRPSRLTLDFSGVSFMDSSGIGLIMGRYRLITELGGKLAISGASPVNERMIRLAGLGRLGIEGV